MIQFPKLFEEKKDPRRCECGNEINERYPLIHCNDCLIRVENSLKPKKSRKVIPSGK